MRVARPLLTAAVVVGLPLLSLLAQAPRKVARPVARPTPRPTAVAADGDPWKEVEGLVSERKLEQASKKVMELLAAARAKGDDGEVARALVREAQLRVALGGFETAVRFLRTETWPEAPLARVTLDLAYASTLVTYEAGYSWEIAKRELVSSKLPPDLTAWTKDQIFTEAERAYADAWSRREALGSEPVAKLARIVAANDYPDGIRGTVRDAVTYLFVELLADTRSWRSGQQDDLFTLDLPSLLAPDRARRAVRPEDPAVHPVIRMAALLDDLETWHRGRGEKGAALETRLERTRRLHEAFPNAEDKAAVKEALAKALPGFRSIPWWSMGQAELALLVKQESAPDALVTARALALEGADAYPESPGGQRCRAIVGEIEAPDYQLESMSSDARERRSVLVTHRNLPALHFRAFALDLPQRIASARDYNLFPSGVEVQGLLKSRRPDASWRVDLPATPDYRSHRTFVVPRLAKPGFYVIAASARADFGKGRNRILSVGLLVTDLVLLVRQEPSGDVEATVVSGTNGRPQEGASVTLWAYDWQNGHHAEETHESGADGVVRFPFSPARQSHSHFLLARRGDDLALDANYLGFQRYVPPAETTASLVYTDRSVYRPEQRLSWKVVAYGGKSAEGSFRVLPQRTLTVTLRDANGQEAASKSVTTDSWGSAWGEFTVPAGRVLGAWRLDSSLSGSAALRVEEYKRPTFEASFREPQTTLRLNREARLTGEAKYLFGLPVSGGKVRWRVVREPIRPWWWGWWGWRPPLPEPRTVAAGTASLKEDGTFEVVFTPRADERSAKGADGITWSFGVRAEVTDEGGETRNASRSFRLGTVAVEARVTSEAGFFRPDEAAALSVSRSDLDGTPRAGKGSWRLVRLEQPETRLPAEEPAETAGAEEGAALSSFRTEGDAKSPRWRPLDAAERILARWREEKEVSRGEVEHDAKGNAPIALGRLAPGAYRLLYETKDPWGAVFTTRKEIVVAGKEARLAVPLALLVERTSVKPGETARVLVTSGLAGQLIYLDVYRGGKVAERRRLNAGRDAALLEFPVQESDRGGFGVLVTAVRDHQVLQQAGAVFVPWESKELEVAFATFRDTLRPGAKETFRVTVKGAASGRPAAAQLLAYMYDRSLDAFGPHQPPSVAGIYPNRTGTGWWRASLGQSPAQWVESDDFPPSFSYPTFSPDRLLAEYGYDIGGPGRRGGGVFRQGRAMAFSPAPAAAPEEAKVARVRSDVALRAETGEMDAFKKKNEAASPPPAPAGEEPLRTNFSETAFFLPNVLTNEDGSAALEFTVPQSVTSWNLWVHALTKDLAGGSLKKEVRTVKELMVRPYVPRFLRQGDQAEVRVVVNDASERALDGTLVLDVLDPESGKSLAAEFGLDAAPRPFHVAAGAGATLTFPLSAPRRLGTVAFKAVATAGEFSDGEVRPIPLLPSRMTLTQSRFVTLKGAQTKTLRFPDMGKDDPSLVNDQLVVTVDAQLFLTVLEALPYLIDYPYECTEQTLNRFVSTGIVSAVFQRHPALAAAAKEMSKRDTPLESWAANDPNRRMALEETPWLVQAQGGTSGGLPVAKVLDPAVARATRETALAKLRRSQTSIGGFPWWEGGPPSPYMTLYILYGFAKAAEFGVEVPKDVVQRGWQYLASYYRSDLQKMMKDDCCWELLTFLNYTASCYPDSSWTGDALTPDERKQILAFSFKHWKEHSPYLKGQLALTLLRMQRPKDARLVWASVMDSAKTNEEQGTYWAPEDRSWLWYNDTTETHAFALRTLMELEPADKTHSDGLVQWLLLDKKLSQWKSTRATAEVVYSLVKYLERENALGVREDATVVVGPVTTSFVFEPDRYTGKKNQVVIPGPKVDPKTMSAISVSKTSPGFEFASATWTFSTEKLPEEERGDFFHVKRTYFKREFKRAPEGNEWTLTPLAEGAAIAVGDQLEVQVSLRTKHQAEYVHLRDPRGAGFEPETVSSGWKWDLGLAYYEEVRDSGESFFFENLPVGEYTFKYRVRAAMAGTFRVAPATVQSMYAPEFHAYSAGSALVVKP